MGFFVILFGLLFCFGGQTGLGIFTIIIGIISLFANKD